MAGGLLQLISTGTQDQYLSVSPEMSYFKQVYKRHTNFSMQSINIPFNSSPFLDGSQRSFDCKVDRFGDMLKDVSLNFQFPNIYSDDKYRFRWIKNITQYMLVEYSVSLSTQQIERRWGEWMDVWNELSLSTDRKYAFDQLSGNIQEYMNPKALTPMVIIKNNRISYSYYPTATGPNNPSLAQRRLYIPLDFWFTKNPSLALPLVALQYQPVTITIIFNQIENLYQIWDAETSMYVSSMQYNSRHGTNISIANFTAFNGIRTPGPSIIDLKAYLDCNYIFLDTPERTYIASTSTDYLIERVVRNDDIGVYMNNTQSLILTNPIKEMIWMLRRRDAYLYNDWANYTASQPEDSTKSPMATAQMLWNGVERVQAKTAEYYNLLQPYQCHTSSPRQGIYCYSFALYPEKIQPSGSFNASMLQTIQLVLTNNPYTSAIPSTGVTNSTEYEFISYAVTYNVFRVIAGSGGMVFTL